MWSKWCKWSLVGILLATVSSVAMAEEEADAGGIMTVSEDEGFGEHPLRPAAHFRDVAEVQGPVDLRAELNPLADRTIAWRTGYIPPQGTVQLSSTVLMNQRVAYSFTDSVQAYAQAALPFRNQAYFHLGGQGHVAHGDSWSLALGAELRHRQTLLIPGTSESGLGVHAAFDVIGTNRLSWTAGVTGNVPLRLVTESIDTDSCGSRRDAAQGGCVEIVPDVRSFPSSGYWMAVHGGVSVFVNEWLLLNAEAFTGVSQGSFYLLEAPLDQFMTYEEELGIAEDSSWRVGLGPLGPVTVGVGSTWRWRRVALQLSTYAMGMGGEFRWVPFFSIGTTVGGSR